MTKTTSEATEKGSLVYPQSNGTGRAVFGVGICCCVTIFWVIVMIVGSVIIWTVADANLTPKFIPVCGAEQQCRGESDVLTDVFCCDLWGKPP